MVEIKVNIELGVNAELKEFVTNWNSGISKISISSQMLL